ncbi:unnamed protein product [Protopolystoma xenopodis]|uniref:Uncharacterized protein n=1 Tax=Protopolystoma xenopodis TaxID=117903 RepID=A0A448WBG3_9PLAT|nr:unnamed protein product [Protopolystoma xenopodis]
MPLQSYTPSLSDPLDSSRPPSSLVRPYSSSTPSSGPAQTRANVVLRWQFGPLHRSFLSVGLPVSWRIKETDIGQNVQLGPWLGQVGKLVERKMAGISACLPECGVLQCGAPRLWELYHPSGHQISTRPPPLAARGNCSRRVVVVPASEAGVAGVAASRRHYKGRRAGRPTNLALARGQMTVVGWGCAQIRRRLNPPGQRRDDSTGNASIGIVPKTLALSGNLDSAVTD